MTPAEVAAHRAIVRAVFRQLFDEMLADQHAARMGQAHAIDEGWFEEWLREERDNAK